MGKSGRFNGNVHNDRPSPTGFGFSASVFLRLLAVVHLVAFASAWVQLAGLIGPHGIAPASAYFAAAHQQLGRSAYFELPSLCWIFGAGRFLSFLCAAGVVVAGLLFAGIAPALCLVLLWAGYLSLSCAGQMFYSFQWDTLLLEATLLAVFVAPWKWVPWWRAHEPPKLGRWLAWWLLFRLMFLAGVVKLASGDPTWRNLTALTFHYETQPLPTPLAWYAHQLPVWWHKLEAAVMFVIELAVPWLLFGPRAVRHVAALTLAGFMALVAATGNYTFFNALAIVLCLFCLDDAWWQRVLRRPAVAVNHSPALAAGTATDESTERTAATSPSVALPSTRRRIWVQWLIRGFAWFAFAYTGIEVIAVLSPALGPPPGFISLARYVEPLRSFNTYGLFAAMTHPRPELIIEGSDDGRDWQAYEFPYKPGDLSVRPKFVAPYQPRLDWQLWFAALDAPDNNPWVLSLCEHLLRGTPEVLGLLAKNPFPTKPPHWIRVVRYEYHFTDAAARARTGHWWRRTPLDLYIPPVALR